MLQVLVALIRQPPLMAALSTEKVMEKLEILR